MKLGLLWFALAGAVIFAFASFETIWGYAFGLIALFPVLLLGVIGLIVGADKFFGTSAAPPAPSAPTLKRPVWDARAKKWID